MMSKQSSAPPTARRYRPGSSAKSALAKARCALKRDNERDAMRRALELAWRGWGRVSTNPLVWAVVLRGDEVIAECWHAEFCGTLAVVRAIDTTGVQAHGQYHCVTHAHHTQPG